MSRNWKSGVGLVAIALVIGFVLLLNADRPALGQPGKDAGGTPRYTVVATDGTHLVVTDNQEAKVYFYAIDKEGKPGDEMKLRGDVNLKDVGKKSIKPTSVK